jgi:hypothetical protein
MKKILVISDTHGYIGDEILKHAKEVDEVWHAGDVGDISVIQSLQEIVDVRYVYGNIDGEDVRLESSEQETFSIDGVKVFMTHIGGYPNKYEKTVREKIRILNPDIVVVGHSHILKVIFDKKEKHLHINPGAIGKKGFHNARTMVRFEIFDGKPQNMMVLEYERR